MKEMESVGKRPDPVNSFMFCIVVLKEQNCVSAAFVSGVLGVSTQRRVFLKFFSDISAAADLSW